MLPYLSILDLQSCEMCLTVHVKYAGWASSQIPAHTGLISLFSDRLISLVFSDCHRDCATADIPSAWRCQRDFSIMNSIS